MKNLNKYLLGQRVDDVRQDVLVLPSPGDVGGVGDGGDLALLVRDRDILFWCCNGSI